MGVFAGGALRLSSTFIYFLEFCCAAIGLSIYSYFLAKLSIHHLHIANDWKAVEGLTGAAVLYTAFAVLLTCFLGGSRFFAILAIVLDLAFTAAFIAVAVLTREGSHSCSGIVTTPLGTGLANSQRAGTHLSLACKLNTAVFATAVFAALLFLISVILQIFVMRHHQKEKKYGPSPANNYTSGSGNRFWNRKSKTTDDDFITRDAELPPAGTTGGFATTTNDVNGMRTSHETGFTGTTMGQNDTYGGYPKYESHNQPQGGVYNKPNGTAANY